MNLQDWQIVLGTVLSAVVTLGPWMLMVHAKLAVVAAKIADMAQKLDREHEAQRELWSLCAGHATRLETHELQLAHLAQQLEDA